MEQNDNPLPGGSCNKPVEAFKRKLNDTELNFNKFKKLENLADGPKFLVIKRSDDNKTMANVSAFLISKCIKSVAGDVKSHSRLADGTILVQTHTLKQAQQLIKLTRLNNEINVSISEHKRLNQSKGFVLCREFKILSDEEILNELASQHVISIKRNKFRNDKGEEVESGSYIITFSTTVVPQFLFVAWERIVVREFIPAPLRCFVCLKLGHHSSVCEKNENQKVCVNCAETVHTTAGERCNSPSKCVNCGGDHQSTFKKCPKYIKEQMIQKIRVQDKVGFREAIVLYNERQPRQPNISYADITKDTKKACGCQCNCNKSKNPTTTPEATTSTTTTTKITNVQRVQNKIDNNTTTKKSENLIDSDNKDNDSEKEMMREIKKREQIENKKQSINKKRKIVISKNGTKQMTMTKVTNKKKNKNSENIESMDYSGKSNVSESSEFENAESDQ